MFFGREFFDLAIVHLDVLAAYEIESYQTDHASGEKSKLPSDKLTEPDNAAVLNSFKSATQAYRMISYGAVEN